MRLAFRTAWPPAIAILGVLPILLARDAIEAGDPASSGAGARRGAGGRRCSSVVCGWVRVRDEIADVVPSSRWSRPMPKPDRRPAVLEADGASKAYADLVALEPLTLRVPAAQAVALVGHNGSGKSTFLRLAAGLLDLTEGEIIDRWASRPARRRRGPRSATCRTSRCSTTTSPCGSTSPTSRRCTGSPPTAADFDELLERRRAAPTAPTTCRPASAAACARRRRSRSAWSAPSRSCSSTSPSSASTPRARRRCSTIFDELHADGAAIVVATHDPSFVERVDRCIALRDGIVVHDGPATPADVLRLVGA